MQGFFFLKSLAKNMGAHYAREHIIRGKIRYLLRTNHSIKHEAYLCLQSIYSRFRDLRHTFNSE